MVVNGMDFGNIIQQDMQTGIISGTTTVCENSRPAKALLFVHGISMNRHSFDLISKKFANEGYFCLSIDLPRHYKNETQLRMGIISETILQSVAYLKQKGFSNIGIVSHSLGAVGSLFASLGYNSNFENEIYSLSEDFLRCIEEEGKLIAQYQQQPSNPLMDKMKEKGDEIAARYKNIKQFILSQLKLGGISQKLGVRCFVFISPPVNVKNAIPGLRIFSRMPEKWVKSIFNNTFHKNSTSRAKKEPNIQWDDELTDKNALNWLFLKEPEVRVFLDYLLNMKEHVDYIQLIETLAKINFSGGKTLFQYYYETYLLFRPKLFVYGKADLFLRPFFGKNKQRLEGYYQSCGNAEIYKGTFSHTVPEGNKLQKISPVMTPMLVKNEKTFNKISDFLSKNM